MSFGGCAVIFTAAPSGSAATWFAFDEATGEPFRIMNVDAANDYALAVLGAYYLVNICQYAPAASTLDQLVQSAKKNAILAPSPSPMLTLVDIQQAMGAPPAGAQQVSCSMADIQNCVPGISFPRPAPITPPAWTDTVRSFCYMMGQDSYPYYSRVWYDWTEGHQLTVFVQKDTDSNYDARLDELLPKGKVGPDLQFSFSGTAWKPTCSDPQGSFVPMSRPDFVAAGGGVCRAAFANNPTFGTMTIWSVALGSGPKWSDFWYWFDDQSRGVVFSLAPAGRLA